jgi:hypothetical protein
MDDRYLEPDEVDALMRERIGQTIGSFALDETSVTLDELVEAVYGDLLLQATSLDELFSDSTLRIAELFCTP